MSVEHIVLFRWRPEATGEQIDSAMAGLSALRGRIAGIVDLTCGANFCDRAQGYTHGLVVRFTDRAGLAAYAPNPAHQEVVQGLIMPIVADVIAMDYETAEA